LLRQAAAEVEGPSRQPLSRLPQDEATQNNSPHAEEVAERPSRSRFSARFLFGEWCEVVDAWQLASWEDYRDVARLGRKTRIGGKQREILWSIFERVRAGLAERKATTWPDLFGRVAARIAADKSPFDFVGLDEAQDVGCA